jgi:subtilase family serine protease
MNRNTINKLAHGITICCTAIHFSATASVQSAQTLRGHVPPAVKKSGLQPIARLSGNEELRLAIGLPLRNADALASFLARLYDPASPEYRRYVTPQQFTERFGPDQKDYEAVIAFAEAHGLRVVGLHPNRVILDVSGSAEHIERAFHVVLRVYPHPNEARTFYAPDAEPSLDLDVPVLSISGLDNFSVPRPMNVRAAPIDGSKQSNPLLGSGPSGMYMGNDFRQAYVPNVSLTGVGQTVGLLEFDGFYAKDISDYTHLAGLSRLRPTTVLLDGFNGTPSNSGGNVEVALDIEVAYSMAPGVAGIIVYEAGPFGNWHDIVNRMATDNLAKQLSCS